MVYGFLKGFFQASIAISRGIGSLKGSQHML